MADKGLLGRFPTKNRALAREIASLGRALELPSTVLILGESGTGKDHLARALHDGSSRAALPFVRIDAANLSDELFESEMFGHERGAFTGAVASSRGLLETAGKGTAYLDDASSLSPSAQAKLLRVLQDKTFRRLGGTETCRFSARLIVSSRLDLAALVEQSLFRPDLFYRIDVLAVRLPRLSDRPEDILPLARSFLKRAARGFRRPARRFVPEAERIFLRHPWPGNIRELVHVVERAVLACPHAEVRPEDLPAGALGSPQALLAAAVEKAWTLRELTDAYIAETLRRAGGNRTLAASRLGVSRKSLWERGRRRRKG
ncbi:MAG TPA: sigma 54-interacting transcriptional regulator [Thermoanaerobaculia bacterium]|nr:sigma 54-interacting transcriptional regulator [Thermoanaerobaculia bacterium]